MTDDTYRSIRQSIAILQKSRKVHSFQNEHIVVIPRYKISQKFVMKRCLNQVVECSEFCVPQDHIDSNKQDRVILDKLLDKAITEVFTDQKNESYEKTIDVFKKLIFCRFDCVEQLVFSCILSNISEIKFRFKKTEGSYDPKIEENLRQLLISLYDCIMKEFG